MKSFLALCSAIALIGAPLFAAEEAPAPAKKPDLLHRMLHPFGGDEKAPSAPPASSPEKKPGLVHRVLHPFGAKNAAGPSKGLLTVVMKLSPLPLKLSAANRLNVTVTLSNHGKKLVPLDFPTSQRIEVLIKNNLGKTIEKWSEDQAFTNEPTLVTINPGERAEYTVEVATREMTAGQSYTVEGFFPSYSALRAEKTIVPE